MKIIENNFRHPLHDALPRQVICEACKSVIELEKPEDVEVRSQEIRGLGLTPIAAIWSCPCCGVSNTDPVRVVPALE